mmetsp:Transcript_15107/g.40896  ORF Transcript_15107/g.40896 Transcript_15107/m.40896 type:complete len:100 (-) Transcript_15107:3270-3569(-)|eukprot:1156978-Pelagomonas_calceolata.AAC.16
MGCEQTHACPTRTEMMTEDKPLRAARHSRNPSETNHQFARPRTAACGPPSNLCTEHHNTRTLHQTSGPRKAIQHLQGGVNFASDHTLAAGIKAGLSFPS